MITVKELTKRYGRTTAVDQISFEVTKGQIAVQPQKFSTIQTLLSAVGAGIATYFPFREGMAQIGMMLFTCQSSCALPAKSTYSKLELHPVGLLVTKRPLESAVQSTEVKLVQFFTERSREGWPDRESN
jgi:hypothetical protein